MDSKVKYRAVTPEGVDRILVAVGVSYKKVREKITARHDRKAAILNALDRGRNRYKKEHLPVQVAALEDWKAELLDALNKAQNFREILDNAAPAKHIPEQLEKVKRRADALAKELNAVHDDGKMVMDPTLRGALVLAAKLYAAERAPAEVDVAAVDDAVEGVLRLSQWAAQETFDFEVHKQAIAGDTALIAAWLPRIYEEFFGKDFPESNTIGPGVRFVHAALAEMSRAEKETNIEAVAKMCFRYRKKRGHLPK